MSDVARILDDAKSAISSSQSLDDLEKIRVNYLGKSGVISEQLKSLGKAPPEQRKALGQSLNTLKQEVQSLIESSRARFEEAALNARLEKEWIDVTLDPREAQQGTIHPITQVMQELIAIFGAQGFEMAEGPDVEDDFHNFTALNIPEAHPARQMHDTFYLQSEDGEAPNVLRTHTSPVQIRAMEAGKPPFRIIAPGRTYRCDSDQTHTPMFHQIEGLYIDKHVTMAQLKGCLISFVETFFNLDDVPVRFRPSFFPFTEPSAEMDIGCKKTKQELKLGEGDDWLEILGCGMVHPNVLKAVNIDPEEYQGFAFGIGIERLAMLKYGIADLRTFFDADSRWLAHYGFAPEDVPSLQGGLVK